MNSASLVSGICESAERRRLRSSLALPTEIHWELRVDVIAAFPAEAADFGLMHRQSLRVSTLPVRWLPESASDGEILHGCGLSGMDVGGLCCATPKAMSGTHRQIRDWKQEVRPCVRLQ